MQGGRPDVAGSSDGPVPASGADGSPQHAELLESERHILSSLAEAINSDLDLQRVLQTVTDVGTEVSRAKFGAFFYNDRDDHGNIYQLHVLSGAGLETFKAMPQPRITGLFQPTFSGEATVRVDDVIQDPRFSGMPPGHLPVRSYLAVPVVARTGEVIGSLLFGHEQPGRFDARCERLMHVVAAQAAVAVENARLFAAEQAARRRAEEATVRLALLQSLTARLSSALTTHDAVMAVAELLTVPLGLSRATLFLRVGNGFGHVSSEQSDDRTRPALTVLGDDLPNPVRAAEVTRSTVIITDAQQFTSEYPHLASLLPTVPETVLVLPLMMAGQVIGVGTLAWDAPRVLAAADVEMLVAAAAQLASAVERARLFDAERAARADLDASIRAATATSRTLQRSLLPRSLPLIDGMNVAVRYQASSVDAEVGGDWYDVVKTATGCVLVIGDVQGHNLTAAALMGQLRTALHAYLAEGHAIEIAVARANDLMRQLTDDMIATCCVAEVDLADGELRVVRAGHPTPICLDRDGGRLALPEQIGLPLGALPGATWEATVVPLSDEDRIVLFTDGLIERRGVDIYSGVAALRESLQQLTHVGPEDAAQTVLDRLGDQMQDDVAILVCDVAPGTINAYSRPVWTASIEGSTDEVSLLRQETRARLRAWGLSEFEYPATLVVSELSTNVLRHTHGPGRLQMQRLANGVRIAVTDGRNRLPDKDLRPRLTATTGRGFKLIKELASTWGIERHSVGKTIWVDITATDGVRSKSA